MEAIFERRSVRQFEPAEMSQADIDKIVLAAQSAPSGCGKYPLHYIVVKSKEQRDWIAANHPYSKFTKDAGLALIVCFEEAKAADFGSQLTFAVNDASAASMNAITAGKMLGWDSVWAAVFPNQAIVEPFVEHFHIPKGVTPMAAISFGKKSPACKIAPVDKHKPEQIHVNTW